MKLTKGALALVLAAGLGGPLAAETPMSAIDWLSDSILTPTEPEQPQQPGVATSALPDQVSVSPIGLPRADAVGLLPISVTGLPPDLWAHSSAGAIANRLYAERSDLVPAMHDLLYQLLLA